MLAFDRNDPLRRILSNQQGSLLITILFAFAGLMCVNIAIQGAGVAEYIQTWPHTEGRVLTAGIEEVSRGIPPKPRTIPRVTYSYEAGGKTYEGDKVLLSEGPYEEIVMEGDTVRLVFRGLEEKRTEMIFSPGSAVTVYHNPERPEEAVLHPYVPAGLRAFWILGIVLILLAMAIGLRALFSAE